MLRGGGVGEPSVSRSPGPSLISPRHVFSLVEALALFVCFFLNVLPLSDMMSPRLASFEVGVILECYRYTGMGNRPMNCGNLLRETNWNS